MLSQVKKIMDPSGRKLVAGQLGAWWDGREFTPDAEDDGEAAADSTEGSTAADEGGATGETPAKKKRLGKPIPPAEVETAGARITALERMWGVGRFGPEAGQAEALDQLTENLLADGDVGMMGADPAMLRAWTDRSVRDVFASEWRAGALERVRQAVPDVTVVDDDVDRTKAFPDDALAALASINTLGFADHKAGLVGRAYHVLKEGGRWVILDTVRTTAKTPPHAFASAWAEPQLVEEAEIDALLEKCGFGVIQKQNLTQQMIETARERMNELGAALEATVSEGMSGSDGVLFLRELVWELKSWRARLKALEGGALQVVLWSTVKGGSSDAEEPEAEPEPEAAAAPETDSEPASEDEDPLDALEKIVASGAESGAEETAAAEDEFEGPSDDAMAARIAAMVAGASGKDPASENAELDESLFDPPA